MLNFLNGTVSNEIYFVYGLIAVVLILILIIVIMDKREKNKFGKKRANALALAKSTPSIARPKEVSPLAAETELMPVQPMVPIIESVQAPEPSLPEVGEVTAPVTPKVEEVTYVEENAELEKTQAQLELQRLTEELKKAQEEDDKINLTHFEVEQEENAIISIHELMKKSNELYDKNETAQYMDEGNEPINLEELQQKFASSELLHQPEETALVVETTKVEEPKKEVVLAEFTPEITKEKKDEGKFKSTPFISPVYGLEKASVSEKAEHTVTTIAHEDSIELEQTADLDQLDEEIRKTNEFLQVLKELQKNLE